MTDWLTDNLESRDASASKNILYKIQNTKYKIQNTEYRIQNTECKIQNTKYKIQNTIQMMVGRQMQLACARVPLINQSVEEKTGRSHKSSNRHHHIDNPQNPSRLIL